jgi:hypothetical protein
MSFFVYIPDRVFSIGLIITCLPERTSFNLCFGLFWLGLSFHNKAL